MSFNERRLNQVRMVGLGPTLLYEPPRQSIVLATYMTIAHNGVGAALLDIYHVENNEAVGVNTVIHDAVPYLPGFFYDLTSKIILNTIENTSSGLYLVTDTADVLNITLYGATIK